MDRGQTGNAALLRLLRFRLRRCRGALRRDDRFLRACLDGNGDGGAGQRDVFPRCRIKKGKGYRRKFLNMIVLDDNRLLKDLFP